MTNPQDLTIFQLFVDFYEFDFFYGMTRFE